MNINLNGHYQFKDQRVGARKKGDEVMISVGIRADSTAFLSPGEAKLLGEFLISAAKKAEQADKE